MDLAVGPNEALRPGVLRRWPEHGVMRVAAESEAGIMERAERLEAMITWEISALRRRKLRVIGLEPWPVADKFASTEPPRRPAPSGGIEAKRSRRRRLLLPQTLFFGGRTRAMPPGTGER
jgi:hypothetical protein